MEGSENEKFEEDKENSKDFPTLSEGFVKKANSLCSIVKILKERKEKNPREESEEKKTALQENPSEEGSLGKSKESSELDSKPAEFVPKYFSQKKLVGRRKIYSTRLGLIKEEPAKESQP